MSLTRRGVLAASAGAATAAAVGAAADRLWARAQARKAARTAAAQVADALKRQAASDAAQEALALRQAVSDAANDKGAALDQVKAQLPGRHDAALSEGFERLCVNQPWLGEVRRSVGYFECYAGGMAYRGAAELLDDQGVLVLCSHEFIQAADSASALFVTFFPAPGSRVRFPVRVTYVDRDEDIAFAEPRGRNFKALAQAYDLRPVRWGDAGRSSPRLNDPVVFVGFPEGIARLHATAGAVGAPRTVDTVASDGALVPHGCKREAAGVTFSGMSGGGAFSSGRFVGLVNFSTPAGRDAFTYYTPQETIRAAYAGLFPRRARATGLFASAQASPPAAGCAIDRRGFIAVATR